MKHLFSRHYESFKRDLTQQNERVELARGKCLKAYQILLFYTLTRRLNTFCGKREPLACQLFTEFSKDVFSL